MEFILFGKLLIVIMVGYIVWRKRRSENGKVN